MPLPTPNPRESRSDFMTRCMDSETMKQEFPEPEQRAAVCSSQWERKDNAQARSAWIVRALTYPVETGMIVLVGLTGCATGGALKSPPQESADPETAFSAEFPGKTGYVCRELQGRADIRAFEGEGRGGRCQQLGKASLDGCFRFSSDRISFESSGCFEASTIGPQTVRRLEEQLDALETEFEAYLKGEK